MSRTGAAFAAWALALPAIAADTATSCDPTPDVSHFHNAGWGIDVHNTRHQRDTAIDSGNVGRLRLRFAFALDGNAPHSYPLLTDDTLFVGDQSGTLYALDLATGCVRWTFAADANIRTAIVPSVVARGGAPTSLLVFGTQTSSVYAITGADGREVWRIDGDAHPHAMITGTPTTAGGKVYVPLSSYEVVVATAPVYGCCTFRGSVLALDAGTGETAWRTYTIDQPARETGTRLIGGNPHGPSGAPVWSAPTIDVEREVVYFGTGENYSDPATAGSDAIFALDAKSGAVRWQRQFTAGDTWNSACEVPGLRSNCPENAGPDFDFGAPPILLRQPDGDLVLAGQKSGGVYAMAAEDGSLRWQRQLGRGGKLGGIHWGMAASAARGLLFVPVSDRGTGAGAAGASPGLFALDARNGETTWSAPAPIGDCVGREQCSVGMSAAVLSTDEVVFAGSLAGIVRAHDATTGHVLWQFDTWRDFAAVNGDEPAHGGAIDVHGPQVGGDTLVIQSGYRSFGQRGGNALLVFGLAPAE